VVRQVFRQLRAWWAGPVIFNRFVLFLVYMTCAAVGAGTWLDTNPDLLLHAVGPEVTAWWGIFVCAAGIVAAATVTSERLENFERAAVSVLAAMILSFVVAVVNFMHSGGGDKTVYLLIAVQMSVVPVAQAVFLHVRAGRKHAA